MDELLKQKLLEVLREKAQSYYGAKPTKELDGLLILISEGLDFLTKNSQVKSVVTTPQGQGTGEGLITWKV
jgi:hypothetical protein